MALCGVTREDRPMGDPGNRHPTTIFKARVVPAGTARVSEKLQANCGSESTQNCNYSTLFQNSLR